MTATASASLPRIAVTGMGVASAIGSDVPAFRDSLRATRSGITRLGPLDDTWPEHESFLGARVASDGVASASDTLLLDPFAQFAVRAAREAMAGAGADWIHAHSDRTAVILGAAVGGEQSRDAASHRVYRGDKAPHPLTIVRSIVSHAVSAVSIEHGITGPSFAVSSACASAAHAIGQACRMLQYGQADVAITGGSDALPSYSALRAWRLVKVLSPDGCRPFAADRNGIVFGEGAGVLVLERLDDALARGATIHGEVAGFGMSSDARSWVDPDPAGLVRCMRDALRDAGLEPADVAYINAHATGTVRGDLAEAGAISQLLGSGAAHVPVSSTKALHGHAFGAAGAIEAIATLLALHDGMAPAQPAAQCDARVGLDVVRGERAPIAGDVALSNSFGFGGVNASLVLRRLR